MYLILFLLLIFVFLVDKGTAIIGGNLTYAGQFPSLAAINVQTSSSRYFCGGSLISDQWILTAGQCVDGATLFTIQLGSNKLEGDDPYKVTLASSNYVVHPDYNPSTLENDVGLIELRMPIEFSYNLRRMEYFAFNISSMTEFWSVGWGQTSDHDAGLSNDLMYADVGPLTTAECQITYGNQVNENTLCVVGNYNEGTCYGDTGSPLILHIGRGYVAQGGIASFISGNGCESTDPSGYIRTFPYQEWIKGVTGL